MEEERDWSYITAARCLARARLICHVVLVVSICMISGIRDRATAATAALYEGGEVSRHVDSVDSVCIGVPESS